MVTDWPGTQTGEREGPQAGEGAGQAGDWDAACIQLHTAHHTRWIPKAASMEQQPKLGIPAAHGASTSARLAPGSRPATRAWG